MFSLKQLKCCFSSMLRVIVLLEGEPPSQSQISGSLKQVSLKNFPVFSVIHHSFISGQFLSPCRWKTSPPLHCGDGGLRVMRGAGFAPDTALSKKLHLSLIWHDVLLPYVWGVSPMPFGEHQTCLSICFLKQWLFSGLSSIKPTSVECTA